MSSKNGTADSQKRAGETKADVLPDRNGRKERLRKAVCRPRILIII